MIDIQESTVGAWLNQVAREHPEREALVHQQRGIRFTYRTFMDQAGRLARGLMALGIQKGDPVALWGSNCPEWVLAQVALAKTGAVLTALDPGYGLEELRYVLSQSGAKAVLTQEGPNGSYLEMLRSLAPDFWETNPRREKALPSLRSIITLSETETPLPGFRELSAWGERVSPSQLRGREDSLIPEDPLMLLFTSGTTGKPKGVVVDHLGILNKSLASTERMKITSEDRLCLFFPLFHMFGNTCICLSGLIRGAALVIPSDQFSPPEVLSPRWNRKAAPPFTVPPPCSWPSWKRPNSNSLFPGGCAPGSWAGPPAPWP